MTPPLPVSPLEGLRRRRTQTGLLRWRLVLSASSILSMRHMLVVSTFDFFVPKHFVMSDTAKERERFCADGDPNCLGSYYPAKYQCKDVYDTWWHGQPGCRDSGHVYRGG